MSSETKVASARWGPERRLELIDFRLRWEGRINRAELVDFFGISVQQASADIAGYMGLAPLNIYYDKQAKTYRASEAFTPLFEANDAALYLSQLGDLAAGVAAPGARFIGWEPPCDIVRYPTRPVPDLSLQRLLKTIREADEIEVTYQSMRRQEASARWITPHALASDGLRWHVRAWCHENADFRDFVLSRITEISNSRPATIASTSDLDWHTQMVVRVRAQDGLSPSQRAAIETDFGMTDGRLAIRCRKALAFYVIRQLHLDRSESASVLEQPLQLDNPEELSDVLEKARKRPDVETANQPS